MREYKRLLPWICLVLLLAITALIFSFSFDSAAESDEKSDDVTRLLQKVCDILNIDIDIASNAIRKTAHFFEFAVLGFMAYLTALEFGYGASPAMLYSLFVATLDETIQIYSPERASSTEDVLLDFAGALFGILLLLLIKKLPKKEKPNRAVE